MIAVMAAFAEGTTIIRDAAELKVKETDRIKTTTEGLLAMGVDVTPTDDGMIIRGGNPVHGGQINSYLDHRIAMAFSIAALAAEGNTEIQDRCILSFIFYGTSFSFPVISGKNTKKESRTLHKQCTAFFFMRPVTVSLIRESSLS